MVEFPDERSFTTSVNRNLAVEFEYSSRVLRYWIECEKDRFLRKSSLPFNLINLAMALHTQGCRQMRSIIEECARCEAFGAEIAARGLFETVLAMLFILKPKVHLVISPILDKQTKKQRVTANGMLRYSVRRLTKKDRRSNSNLLSQELRTELYLSSILFQHQAHAERCQNTLGGKRIGKTLAALVDPKQVAAQEAFIGPRWTYLLRDSGAYSGLSVSELAKLLHPKLHYWYNAVYGPQSQLIHGAMAIVHTRISKSGTLGSAFLSEEEEVRRVLQVGTMLFRILMAEMQNNIGFGGAVEMVLDAFLVEFMQVFGADES